MFKPARWWSEKNRIKVVFKLQFHASQVSIVYFVYFFYLFFCITYRAFQARVLVQNLIILGFSNSKKSNYVLVILVL